MFFNNIHTRMRVVLIIVIICLCAIIFRVFYIQVFSYKRLNNLAESLWSRKLPITADRGKIMDRNGKILADNVTTTSLVVIPNQIKNKEEVARSLAEILGTSYEDMFSHINKKTSIERIHPEGRRLSYETAEKINNLELDGVYLVKESKRYYPYGNTLSHVLGYVGIDNQGLSGIESELNDYLTGENGSINYFSDGKGKRLKLAEKYVEPQNGIDVNLTIDLDLQLAVEKELDNVVDKYNPDQALILAMNPKTSEILAMSSRPNFNPNNYKDYSVEVINRNLPIWMTYEPGSTFKIITLSASLEEKTIDLFKDNYYDSGSINVEGSRIKCWKSGGHGAESFLQVVENSCNPGFVVMGQKLGKDTLMKYITNFGFGEKTGVDLNGEASGILFPSQKMGPVELATTSFGQGISVTPIQQAVAVSAAINGGVLHKPYIVSKFSEPETGVVIKSHEQDEGKRVISEDTSKLVRFALESVVANGSGKNAYIENYRIGGKTGTAQKVNNGSYMVGNYIVSFMGFMPADDPELVVYVAIDNPKGVTQYGGVVSAPIAKNVFNSAISLYKFPKSREGMPRIYTWLDTKYVMMSDVTGKTLDEAKKELKGFKIKTSGEGDKVLYQSPEGGYFREENSEVVLMLSR